MQLIKSGPGRPRKFGRPSRSVTVTLPEDVLTRLGGIDSDLALAVDSHHLGKFHAVLFTADSGSLAGETFLIVDANGVAGYQSGSDLVLHLAAPANSASLSIATFV